MKARLAAEALGQASLGEARAELLAFVVGLLLTFLGVRLNTRLIRARVSWWFHDIERGGTHVHHMVFGVVIMVATGLLTFAFAPDGLGLQVLAFCFGVGVALTLDEFALILHLEDVYWSEKGRVSVDAVVVVVGASALTLMAGPPLVSRDAAAASVKSLVAIAVVDLVFAIVAVAKGKLWTGFVGIWVPFVALVGAVRLARPGSPWARSRYAHRPAKQARAEEREARRHEHAARLKLRFYDAIAGRPSATALEDPPDEHDGGGRG